MFYFGDPESIAMTYYAEARASSGPAVPDVHVDDLTADEALKTAIYTRVAFNNAEQAGAPQEVLDVIISWYDELFCIVAATSQEFCDTYRRGGHHLIVISPEAQRKYDRLFAEHALAD